MPMLVVLLDAPGEVAALDVATARRLAVLGVTQVTIARDHSTEAVVLEGWAFNVAADGTEASAMVGAGATTRSLRPVLQTLITPDQGPRGGVSDHRSPSTKRTSIGFQTKGSS